VIGNPPAWPALGTLSSILLNGGEGRGEEALIKTCSVANHQSLWLLGSNVKILATDRLNLSPTDVLSRLLALENLTSNCSDRPS
jgi:hypothetical protein